MVTFVVAHTLRGTNISILPLSGSIQDYTLGKGKWRFS